MQRKKDNACEKEKQKEKQQELERQLKEANEVRQICFKLFYPIRYSVKF